MTVFVRQLAIPDKWSVTISATLRHYSVIIDVTVSAVIIFAVTVVDKSSYVHFIDACFAAFDKKLYTHFRRLLKAHFCVKLRRVV